MVRRLVVTWMTRTLALKWASVVVSLVAATVVLGSLAWLSWTGIALRKEIRLESDRAVRIAEVRGEIVDLDDQLAMTARLAAVSGEARWVARYDEQRPRLAAALDRAAALANPEIAAELSSTLDEANRNLDMMERAVMARSIGGDRRGALSLIDGPECEFLQASYTSGMETFDQELAQLARMRTEQLDHRAWRELFGLTGVALLVVTLVLCLSGQTRLRLAFLENEVAARTDPLTGLANRLHLLERLRQALRTSAGGGKGVALLLLDLDQFKAVNDLYGYPTGDNLLRLVAERLRGVIAQANFIARLGSDEFAIITAVDLAGTDSSIRDDAAHVAAQVKRALGPAFDLSSGNRLQIGLSIGITVALCETATAEAVIRQAEIALHQVKSDRPGSFQFFEPGMDLATVSHASLANDLRHAIGSSMIVPHFQPLVKLETGRIIGFEMLARWTHPARGVVSPVDFIPVAEEIGLIGTMTECLLRRACEVAAGWPADISLACNISPSQLRDRGLVRMIRLALDESRLPPHRLELEITENALVGDLKLANEILRELKALGIQLALDDFGTGYSSLKHLQTLPFDTLKIDASFVSAMAADAESHKIVSAVVGLGRSLNLRIVAEGIEEPVTASLLRALDCDVGQGWLFGRPRPAEDVEELIHQQQPSGGIPVPDLARQDGLAKGGLARLHPLMSG